MLDLSRAHAVAGLGVTGMLLGACLSKVEAPDKKDAEPPLLSEPFTESTLNTSRWFVLESGKNAMFLDTSKGKPAPALRFVWPNNVQNEQGLQ